jgi:hypothetical protein
MEGRGIVNKMIKRASIITIITLIAGCSIQTLVEPIPPQTSISEICILENPKVIISDFLPVVQENISRHGLRSSVYRQVPSDCVYVLDYVAYQRWDFTLFMSDASIKLYRDKKLVGSVSYQTPTGIFGGGGANPAKWKSTKEKLDPLLDELFKNYPGPSQKQASVRSG